MAEQKKDDTKLLETARERFRLAEEAEDHIRDEALDDLKFRAGEQWPDDIENARKLEKRPCLTINRLPQFIRQVTNDQRQNRPAIQVNPVDDQGDPETAEILQGLVRHIEHNSSADIAYDTAFEHAVTMGFGYFRVITNYVDPMSFDQEILIKRIKNPFTVYFDPTCQEPDYSDAGWAFIVDELTEGNYKEQYPDSELASLNDWVSIGDHAPGWLSKNGVRIAEYFVIEQKRKTIVLLSDKSVIPKDKLPETLPEDLTIVAERETLVPVVKWYKINGIEVLEETEWVGKWIPIVPVLGDEIEVDGKRELCGLVRFAKDPQRMYNYWATAETEMIALAPKAPWVMAEGQDEGYERQWDTANTKNYSRLVYKPKSLNGEALPPPSRNYAEPPVQAITQARLQSSDDLKATTGIYDASLGARGNETSGKAILARQREGDVANFHYIDNLTRAIRHLGRILVDLIPRIYDAPRVLRIIGEDGSQKTVQVNQPVQEQGVEKIYDLTTGKYDVIVSVGPSYTSKRQEAVESMMQLTQNYPKLAEIAGDLLVKNMDWPGAKEIAERIRKTLPPGMAEQENEQDDGKTPMPPEMQAQFQQMQQMIEQLTQALNQAQDKLEGKEMELESKERIAFAQMQVDLMKTMATIESKEALAAFQQELGHINDRLNILGINQPIEEETPIDGGASGMLQSGQSQQATGGPAPGDESME